MGINIEDEQYDSGTFEPLPEGDYEVVVKKAQKGRTKGGQECILIEFKVVYGQYKDRIIFQRVFRSKDNPNEWDIRRLVAIARTQKGQPHYKTQFADVDALIQYINGLSLCIGVEKYLNEKDNTVQNQIKRGGFDYKASHLIPGTTILAEGANVAPTPNGGVAVNAAAIEVTDDELPF